VSRFDPAGRGRGVRGAVPAAGRDGQQRPELGQDPAGGPGTLVARRASRRDRLEALGLLLGILGMLLIVSIAVGSVPPA
jgi:hypothetical protein